MSAVMLPFPGPSSLGLPERTERLLQLFASSGRLTHTAQPEIRALAALLCALGADYSPRSIIESIPQDASFTLESLMHGCTNLGYHIHILPMHGGAIDTRLLPCLFHADDGNLYILIEQGEEGIYAYNARHSAFATIAAATLGAGKLICPRPHDHQQHSAEHDANKATGHGWLHNTLSRYGEHFTQLLLTSFVINLVALSTPILIMLVYDRVIGVHATNDLPYLAVGFGLALAVESTLRFMRARHLAWLGTRIDVTSTHAIIERLLHLPANMIERASVASQIARIKGFEEIRDFFTGPLFLTLIELPFTLLMLAALALIAGELALIPLAAALLCSSLFLLLRPYTRHMMFRAARSHSELQKATLESFKSMETLRTSGMQEAWHTHVRDLSAEASYRMFRSSFFGSLLETSAYAITTFAGLAILYLGVGQVLAGTMSAGALIASLMFSWRILTPVAMLCTMLPRLEQLKQTARQLDRLMEIAPENYRNASAVDSRDGLGKVELSNVGIRYSKESEPVFAGLSLQADKGQLIGIMGGNGCGKSTLLKLVMGLYHPQAGTIRLDGTDIRQFSALELRRNFAYVPQNPDFFTGTIAENLRLADPCASDADLRKALVEVGVWQDVERLPNGLNTFLDCTDTEGTPTLLSYRLNLARACLSPGKIVLCDELPYALLNDRYGEHYQTLLKRWQGSRTTFFVSHREDFIALADIVVGLRRSGPPLIGPAQIVLPLMKEESYEAISARAR